MVATIVAALKALPLLVQAIEGVRAEIKTMANNKTEQQFQEIKEKVNVLTHRFALTKDRDEMLGIVSDLNDLVDNKWM